MSACLPLIVTFDDDAGSVSASRIAFLAVPLGYERNPVYKQYE